MRNFYLIPIIVLLFLSSMVNAQQAPQPATAEFTLEQCVSYALENSDLVKNATLDEKISEAVVKETRGIGLPQISGSVGITHNQKLRRFFATYSTDQPGILDLSGIPGIQSGDVVALQNFFQLKSGGDAGITISQILFNSSYLVGLQAASTYRELSVKTTQQTKEHLVADVTKAYYNALINQERIELFNSNIERVESLLKTTKALNENGFAESIDVDRVQVTLNNLIVIRDNFTRLQQLSLELLKFQMDYPMENAIKVKGDISSIAIESNPDVYKESFEYSQRTEYGILETQRRLQTLNIKNLRSASLPSLVAFANLGYATQSPNVGGLFKTNSNIQENSGLGPDKWYSYAMYGVTLNIPIFNGLQQTYKVQQAKFGMQKIDNAFHSLKSGIDLDIKGSSLTYKNALRSLESQKSNMTLAENIARVTKIKFEQGVGSNLEVVDAESSLRETQVNYYNALFDALVAKVDLDKAYGKLTPTQFQEK